MSELATLTQEDLAVFARLGIGPRLLNAAGVCRVMDVDARANWGIRFSPAADLSGLIFPYLHSPWDRLICALR